MHQDVKTHITDSCEAAEKNIAGSWQSMPLENIMMVSTWYPYSEDDLRSEGYNHLNPNILHFSNQPSVCTATSTQSRMTTTDSLTGRKPNSEGPTQDTVQQEHTGRSTDPIGSSTGSQSGSSTGSTAALSPTMGTADDAHDPTTGAPAFDPTGQDKDRGQRTTALGARRTAPPSMQKTAISPNATSLPESPTACWEEQTATSHGKPLSSATAISARMGRSAGSIVQHTTGSVVDSTDLLSAEANKVVFSRTQRRIIDSRVLQGTKKPQNRQQNEHMRRREENRTRALCVTQSKRKRKLKLTTEVRRRSRTIGPRLFIACGIRHYATLK